MRLEDGHTWHSTGLVDIPVYADTVDAVLQQRWMEVASGLKDALRNGIGEEWTDYDPRDFLVVSGMTRKQFALRRMILEYAAQSLGHEGAFEDEDVAVINITMGNQAKGCQYPTTVFMATNNVGDDRYRHMRDLLIHRANEMFEELEEPLLPSHEITGIMQ